MDLVRTAKKGTDEVAHHLRPPLSRAENGPKGAWHVDVDSNDVFQLQTAVDILAFAPQEVAELLAAEAAEGEGLALSVRADGRKVGKRNNYPVSSSCNSKPFDDRYICMMHCS